MFPVKHTVIYTFFAITSVQNTCFCSVFNALASKNPAKSCYVQCFFHFWPFFHCRKATKMTQNSISIPSCAQTPKNPRKMSKTPPYSGLGAKPFLAPPPPAKADIATAILTNVIEHLVLLLPPNKHAFTAKAVWADFFIVVWLRQAALYVRRWVLWNGLWLHVLHLPVHDQRVHVQRRGPFGCIQYFGIWVISGQSREKEHDRQFQSPGHRLGEYRLNMSTVQTHDHHRATATRASRISLRASGKKRRSRK